MDSQPSKPRLRENFRTVMRMHHYSIRTEKTCWYWIRYFLRFHGLRHRLELGPAEVSHFLGWPDNGCSPRGTFAWMRMGSACAISGM